MSTVDSDHPDDQSQEAVSLLQHIYAFLFLQQKPYLHKSNYVRNQFQLPFFKLHRRLKEDKLWIDSFNTEDIVKEVLTKEPSLWFLVEGKLESQMDVKIQILAENFKGLSSDALDQVLEFAKISEEKQKTLLQQYNAQAEGNFEQKTQTAENLEQQRFEEIKARYQMFPEDTKMNVEAILHHLESQLKNDLKYFDASEDRIYMDEFRKIEPLTKQMYDKLYYAHGNNSTVPHMKDILSRKTEKVTKRLDKFKVTDETTLKEYRLNTNVEYARRNASRKILVK